MNDFYIFKELFLKKKLRKWICSRDYIWATKAKIFLIWFFTGEVGQSLSYLMSFCYSLLTLNHFTLLYLAFYCRKCHWFELIFSDIVICWNKFPSRYCFLFVSSFFYFPFPVCLPLVYLFFKIIPFYLCCFHFGEFLLLHL